MSSYIKREFTGTIFTQIEGRQGGAITLPVDLVVQKGPEIFQHNKVKVKVVHLYSAFQTGYALPKALYM